MPSDNNEMSFKGESGAECEAFILQVYAEVRREGRTWDSAWIAVLVSTCFRGKALRWYVKLPLETRRDWELLQLALFERWPSEDDEAKPSLAAAVPPHISSSFAYKIGRLKAKVKGSDAAHWVSTKTQSGASDWRRIGGFTLANDSETALHVQIIPLENQVWRLKMLNHPNGYNFVAMYIPGSLTFVYGLLIGVDVLQGTSLLGHRSTYCGEKDDFEFQADIWSFSDEERVLSIHPKAIGKSEGCVYLGKSEEDTIMFSGRPLRGSWPEVELFFEPLDL